MDFKSINRSDYVLLIFVLLSRSFAIFAKELSGFEKERYIASFASQQPAPMDRMTDRKQISRKTQCNSARKSLKSKDTERLRHSVAYGDAGGNPEESPPYPNSVSFIPRSVSAIVNA